MKILEMSIAGSACILVVLALRVLLRKMPKVFSYVLWAIVFLRLICPFSLRSSHFGLMLWDMGQKLETAAYEQELAEYQLPVHKNDRGETDVPMAEDTYTDWDNMVSKSPHQGSTDNAQSNMIGSRYSHSVVQRQERRWVTAGSAVWAAGVAVLLGYSLVSYILLRRRLRQAVKIQEGVYESDRISTPFLLGVLNSRIYLPMGLEAEEKAYVLAHELVHLRRRDYLVKMVTWLILSLHWFNPLVWLAYGLMVRDMEMSCDESVIRGLGKESKKAYSQTLLAISGSAKGDLVRKLLPTAPLSFGEKDIRSRVKNILAYRSVKAGTGVLLILLLIAAGIVLMTDWQESSSLPGNEETEKLPASAEQIPDEAGTDGFEVSEADTSNEGGEQADSDDEERRSWQLEDLREMDRDGEMTWEQLQVLAEKENPLLEDYAGYTGAVWPEEDDSSRSACFIYYLYDSNLDQNYRLDIYYMKEDLKLVSVHLLRESDGDRSILYWDRVSDGEGVQRYTEIDAFRRDIKRLSDWVGSWELPHEEQVLAGEYQADLVTGGGVLFTWKEEKRDLDDAWAPEQWKSAGGFTRIEREEMAPFVFDNEGKLTDMRFLMNHTDVNGSAEVLEGCQEQAVLLSMVHDLYTVSELHDLAEAGRPVPEEETTADFWYIGFAREDVPYGYVLFLAERYFTREEAIAMARSIRFTEEAWAAE